MNISKKVCIAVSVVCLVILGILFISWRNQSVKEAEMTAAERRKNNAEVSSIYKRKIEEAKTATEMPSSETTETSEGAGQEEQDKPAETPDQDPEGTEATPAGTEDGGNATKIEDGQVVDFSQSTEITDSQTPAASQTPAVSQTPAQGDQQSQGAYQLLKNKQPLRLMVVGDAIAAGRGASQKENGWPELLADGFERRFGSQTALNNAAMDPASVYTTYAEVMGTGQDDQDAYDMAIICCGREDNENSFGQGYEAVVRAIHKKYPACTILAVKEHDLAVGSAIDQGQDTVNKAYKVRTVDMRKAFAGQEDQLLDETGSPNDAGHRKYAQVLFAAVHRQVEKGSQDQVPDREPVFKESAAYENYTYYGADQFTRVNNTSYELKTGHLTGMLGIDYLAYDRDESVVIGLDQQSFALSGLNLSEDSKQLIRLVKSNFTVNDKITVSFRDKEQADAFGGLIVTGR